MVVGGVRDIDASHRSETTSSQMRRLTYPDGHSTGRPDSESIQMFYICGLFAPPLPGSGSQPFCLSVP